MVLSPGSKTTNYKLQKTKNSPGSIFSPRSIVNSPESIFSPQSIVLGPESKTKTKNKNYEKQTLPATYRLGKGLAWFLCVDVPVGHSDPPYCNNLPPFSLSPVKGEMSKGGS